MASSGLVFQDSSDQYHLTHGISGIRRFGIFIERLAIRDSVNPAIAALPATAARSESAAGPAIAGHEPQIIRAELAGRTPHPLHRCKLYAAPPAIRPRRLG